MFGIPSPWLIGGVAAVVIGASVTGFVTGKNYQYRIDAVASLKAEIATLKFDRDLNTRKAAEAEADRATLEAADTANQDTIDALEKQLAAVPDGSVCRADDAGIKRLLNIR